MIRSPLRFFQLGEFRHPELVADDAAVFLDNVRQAYGQPLVITSDARTAEENTRASGSSPTSLHLLGRAFDLRMPSSPEFLFALVQAILTVAGDRGIELELVHGPHDQHIHVGLWPNEIRPSRLVLNLT